MNKREAVAAHYHRLKSSKLYPVMPPLSDFRELPIMKYLANRDSAAKTDIDVEHELRQSTAVQNMLRDDLRNWTERAEDRLGAILGYPGYRLLSRKKLHPVYRVTARFTCQRCNNSSITGGNAARSQKQRVGEGSMDFEMACSHVCFGLSKKRRLNYRWSAEQFVPDEKVGYN